MKKVSMFLSTIFLFTILLTANANALPILNDGYTWDSSDYWSLTDFTTATSTTQIQIENASFESNFGFYTVDDVNKPTKITSTLQVWGKIAEPGFDTSTVKFREDDGSWFASVNGGTEIDFDVNWGF